MRNSSIKSLVPNPPLAAYGTVVSGVALPGAKTPVKTANAQALAQPAVPTPDDIKTLVADIQRKIASVSPELQFTVDQQSGQPIVTMTDKTTKEVLWQFPSDEVLQVRKALDQYQRGTLVNHKA